MMYYASIKAWKGIIYFLSIIIIIIILHRILYTAPLIPVAPPAASLHNCTHLNLHSRRIIIYIYIYMNYN